VRLGTGERMAAVPNVLFWPLHSSRTVALPYRLFVSAEMVGFVENEKLGSIAVSDCTVG
jgi:hypothetical protein